jgi:hypothetical protein
VTPLTGSGPRYVPSGHLIYRRADRLEVVPFSLNLKKITGPAAQIPEPIPHSRITGLSQFSFSNDGSLFYPPGSVERQGQLVSVDLEGQEAPLFDPLRHYVYPRYSPSGSRVAVIVFGRDGPDLWVIDLRTGVQTRLTSGGGVLNSLWNIDGDRLLFARESSDPPLSVSLFSQKADGSGPEEILLAAGESGEMLAPYSLARDEDLLIYEKSNPLKTGGNTELWLLELGSGERRPLLAAEGVTNMGAALSPDGRWLAYVSDVSGRYEVYVQRFPQGGERHQISTNGALAPLGSPDGRNVYFKALGDTGQMNTGQMMGVAISTEEGFAAGSPEPLFDLPTSFITYYTAFPFCDLSPDGKSFVAVKEVRGAEAATEIRVVENWFQELERLAPTSRN